MNQATADPSNLRSGLQAGRAQRPCRTRDPEYYPAMSFAPDVQRRLPLTLLCVFSVLFGACQRSRPTQYPPPTPPGPYASGPYGSAPGVYSPGRPPPSPAAPQPAPGVYSPGRAPPSPAPPATAVPARAPAPVPTAPPTVAGDPINANNLTWMRSRGVELLHELVAALPAAEQQRVQNIPLIVDSTVGEVNAFATCTSTGKGVIAVSDGLYDIAAHLAEAKANDELFHTNKLNEYEQLVAKNQRPNQPVVEPPPGFFPVAEQIDARKVARQHVLFDEEVAFVIGHELGHHYLGHLNCSGQGTVTAADVARVLSNAVPLFNQPNEFAADSVGTNNVLTAGAHRQGAHWTEEGAILLMNFFARTEQLSPTNILFTFDHTHPPAQLRIPVIEQTANAWRATGGTGLPIVHF